MRRDPVGRDAGGWTDPERIVAEIG